LAVILRGAFQRGPCVVLVFADDVGEARLVAMDVALGGLLEERVKAQQREVARTFRQLLTSSWAWAN
jgi:hypothetical protein